LALVVLLSLCLLGNRYSCRQWCCFVVVVLGGLMLIAERSLDGGGNMGWYLLYAIGAWAIGVANTVTENVMRNVYRQTQTDSTGLSVELYPGSSSDREYLISASQYLCLTNVYSIVIVLALAWVPRIAFGTEWFGKFANGMQCLWTLSCNEDDLRVCEHQDSALVGVAAAWIAAILSFISAYVAAVMQRRQDVVFVSVAYALAPVVSMAIFLNPWLMGEFYHPPTRIDILSNMVTLAGGLLFKYVTLLGDPLPPRTTRLTRMFKLEPLVPSAESITSP